MERDRQYAGAQNGRWQAGFAEPAECFPVSLPEAVTGKDPVSVTKAGYTLSFTMQEVSGGAPASVKQPSRAEKKAAQEAPEAVQEAKLERQSASLVYEDVQPDTDVEYTVLP